MDYLPIVGGVLVAIGLVGGAMLVARSPKFWIDFGSRVLVALAPIIWKFVSKRMTPEEEARWRHEQLSGVKPPTTGVTTTQPAATSKPKGKP